MKKSVSVCLLLQFLALSAWSKADVSEACQIKNSDGVVISLATDDGIIRVRSGPGFQKVGYIESWVIGVDFYNSLLAIPIKFGHVDLDGGVWTGSYLHRRIAASGEIRNRSGEILGKIEGCDLSVQKTFLLAGAAVGLGMVEDAHSEEVVSADETQSLAEVNVGYSLFRFCRDSWGYLDSSVDKGSVRCESRVNFFTEKLTWRCVGSGSCKMYCKGGCWINHG